MFYSGTQRWRLHSLHTSSFILHELLHLSIHSLYFECTQKQIVCSYPLFQSQAPHYRPLFITWGNLNGFLLRMPEKGHPSIDFQFSFIRIFPDERITDFFLEKCHCYYYFPSFRSFFFHISWKVSYYCFSWIVLSVRIARCAERTGCNIVFDHHKEALQKRAGYFAFFRWPAWWTEWI